ncbi:MAG TPA: 30S ribosomal protein S12 methylthiotransferase RimO [Bacteroidales bacterium]|nr:30S ribosomal protein S12 methylthiotransferase RimO [Bacteroidales bacterium]HPX43808.1 30S ribosomal protein S12 methylthiotransferase RimO [Bacteroidales bacterium]HQB86337.1 30S ribosomal protein S12 methylthiotransferase RimO [Bacteroidales bacterium]
MKPALPGLQKGNRLINIVTLGCSKNTVDSEKLLRQIKAAGYSVAYDPMAENADTVIINTCGFINDAKEESIDTILRFVKAGREGRIRKLYVMGCLSERYRDELIKEIPEVDRYFGVNSMREILDELETKTRPELLSDRVLTGPSHYAYLKVSEGCDRKCAFCAIPLIRGKHVSRKMEDIIGEAEILARQGVRELILIAQDLSYYGLDLYGKRELPRLLSGLLSIDAFEWIRLHYLYPAGFPKPLISLMRDNPKICSYIDIPIQHISGRMLKIMKRSHDAAATRDLLHGIRRDYPEAAVRTTLIAGHPGETEADYLELRDFVSEYRFDRLGVFAYSHEEGTWSGDKYPDDVPDDIKESRVSELMAIQQSISAELNESKTGRVLKTVIDRREGAYYVGRTEYDSPEVDNEVLISSEKKLIPDSFYRILITGAAEFDLFGTPAEDSL